jgi:hypothetical protein
MCHGAFLEHCEQSASDEWLTSLSLKIPSRGPDRLYGLAQDRHPTHAGNKHSWHPLASGFRFYAILPVVRRRGLGILAEKELHIPEVLRSEEPLPSRERAQDSAIVQIHEFYLSKANPESSSDKFLQKSWEQGLAF